MKKGFTLSALAILVVTGAAMRFGETIVDIARDFLVPQKVEVPTIGSEFRIVLPPNVSVGEIHVARPITGTHIEIKPQIYKIE